MSFHHDPAAWLRLAQENHCAYCQKDDDPAHSSTLKLFTYSELCAHPRVCLKGTCYLISRQHYVELFDLGEAALLGFMQEAQVAARVLKDVTGAFRINYEIHGNTIPHFHLHLFPRYLDDPFGGVSIDYARVEPPVYAEGEFDRFVATMQARLETVELS